MTNLVLIISLQFLLNNALTVPEKNFPGYNFSHPDATLVLPGILHEISGLITIDQQHFACIQDENGILFIYNAAGNNIVNQYTFHIDGDYEGIARVENTIFILRSDGTLFEITDYTNEKSVINSYPTGIPANNNEGLCYDAINHRLLIAAKGKPGKGPEFKNKRVIYGFDLETKQLTETPVLELNLQTIKQAVQEWEPDLPVRLKKKGKIADPVLRFRTSEIAIHPVSGNLFLLSASDYMLFVFSLDGTLLYAEKLSPLLFNKAEGITFFENGDMLISNEGQKMKPTVLRFNYQHAGPGV